MALIPRRTMVVDDGWLMISNKPTEDKAAPQPTGSPYWYGLPDAPIWESPNPSVVANSVLSGQRYTVLVDGISGWYLAGRFWTPIVGSSVRYDLYVVENPTTAPAITSIVQNFESAAIQWHQVNIPPAIILPGEVFDVILEISPTGPNVVTNANYDYILANGDPAMGEIWHQNAGGGREMRVSYFDADMNDLESSLGALVAGDEISAQGFTWSILDIVHIPASHFIATVTPATRGQSQLDVPFTFTSYTPIALEWNRIINHYSADPQVQGLWSATGYGNISLDESAYGVDLRIQNAALSADWDAMAFSG